VFDNGISGSASSDGASLPWTRKIIGSGLFDIFDVTAVRDTGGGTISCTLAVDGKAVASQSGTGQYTSVDCSGST
jgi:hypothetical protein